MKKQLIAAFAATGLALSLVSPASAAVTFNDQTGTGFVGKGDVQLALNWNNKQLQDNEKAGNVAFTYNKTTVQETTWECINERNENVQERERTTTTTITGVVSHTARERNQITGFNLTGFSSSSSTTETEGPKLNSCPNANSSYVLGSTVVGDPEVVSGGLFVNGVVLS